MLQPTNRQSIRERAEQRLNGVKRNLDVLESDLVRTIRIHEFENQIKNEDLLATQSRLEQTLQEYEELFELSPIGYFILDKNGVIKKANARAGFHFGLHQESLIGRDFTDFLCKNSYEKGFFHHQELIIDEQKVVQLECEVRRDNGTMFPSLIKSIVVKDCDSRFKYMFAILTDISKIKEHEHQVEVSLNKAERLNEMFSNFMSIASHEFRTPLSAVLSSNSLVGKYAKLGQTDMMNKHLSRIKTSVKVLVTIIEDFLSLEKVENGSTEIIKTNFNLFLFCEDINEEIQSQTRPGQTINYSNRGNPEIISDKKVLQHILMNLLSNACKYSQENSEIHFTSEVSDEIICITIKDTGIGIPESQREKIFTRFFRARNALTISGTGLGLYICKRYVELLNGTISFTSETGIGTTFTVKIPIKSPQEL